MVSGVPQQEYKVERVRCRVDRLALGSEWSAVFHDRKVQSPIGERGLQETQTGVHAWNHLPFGVTEMGYCFSVGFIRVTNKAARLI